MNDPYEIFDQINLITEREGLAGFDAWFEGLDEDEREGILDSLSDPGYHLQPYQRLPYNNEVWKAWYQSKYEDQLAKGRPIRPLEELDLIDWRVWLLRMGRGSGKTYAASCGVHEFAENVFPGGVGIIIGPTVADVRDTQINGKSGLKATQRESNPVTFNQHTNTLHWANGSMAYVRTSEQGDQATRGLTVNWAWGDEVLKWKNSVVYDNLERCVREKHPNGTRIILTTTPQGGKEWIRSLEAEPDTIVSVATSLDNKNQDAAVLAKRERELLVGGKLAQEEILGEWPDADEQLWTAELLEGWRDKVLVDTKAICNTMDLNMLSLDPSKGNGGDDTGMCLLGLKDQKIRVLADLTCGSSFETWTDKVAEYAKLYLRPHDIILIEENGFIGIDTIIREKMAKNGAKARIRVERPPNSKWYRAQEAFSHCRAGHVRFYGHHDALEKQLKNWTADQKDSPDRGDAFTLGVNDLMGSKGRGLRPAFTVGGLGL